MEKGMKWMVICGLAGALPAAAALAGDNAPTAGEAPIPSATSTTTSSASTAPMAPPVGTVGDPTYTAYKLHRTNQMEIKVGKLEQQKGESPRVKQYAAQLVRDHQAADRQVMAFAKKHKIEMNGPTGGEARNTDNTAGGESADEMAMDAEMKRLESLNGAELDRAYLTSMVTGHDKAIDFVRSARGATHDTDLASLLDQQLPSLKKHSDMAATLTNSLHGTSMQ